MIQSHLLLVNIIFLWSINNYGIQRLEQKKLKWY